MSRWSQHLYLRIWLAVVLGVAVLMLVVWLAMGWAWRTAEQHYRPPPMRQWVLRNDEGQVLDVAPPERTAGGIRLEFEVVQDDGRVRKLVIERSPAPPPGPGAGPMMGGPGMHAGSSLTQGGPARFTKVKSMPWWLQPTWGFALLLATMGVAAALALYPVVRRLTKRLEALQTGVQSWGQGDLSVRVPVQGDDEVADLSRRFNDAAQRLQALMAAQKSLLANASHELRSPLARIRMGLELLESPAGDAALRQRSRDEILRNMAELDQLIDEILLASRLDAQEADIGQVEPVDLIGLCAEECARVDALLTLPEPPPQIEVPGVARLLRRLVRNLLENARRYGQAAAPDAIVLALRVDGTHVTLTVCDRGPGVPEAWRERIFEPFLRLPGASESSGGVGLGLALVRSIAQRHGGSVRCTDREGGGACFEVRLPKA
ncbi:MAG: Sensor protein RstB [Pseudomonadota bacterium]